MPLIRKPFNKALLDQCFALAFPCQHPSPELRLFRDARGTRRVYSQCQCGRKLGEIAWRKRKDIDLSMLPKFDIEACARIRARVSEFYVVIHGRIAKKRNADWWHRYSAYLASDVWQRKRRSVLERAKFRCERDGCRNMAEQVHHLTYERAGEELPEDLHAVCVPCHALFHPPHLASRSMA